MGTGQNLTQIDQTISFYNVYGLIERDKDIYFVPFVRDLLSQGETTVKSAYKKLFDTVCPPPFSDFKDITISSWNPTDRKLKVRGNVDMFRKGSSSNCLNYMVLTRDTHNVSLGSFYQGFFIVNAYQEGVNTVGLILEPDNFTNTLFWGNGRILTEDFDPINPLVRNTLVERQHYDRVSVAELEVIEPSSEPITSVEYNKNYYLSKLHLDSAEEYYQDTGKWVVDTGRTRQLPNPAVYLYINRMKYVKASYSGTILDERYICSFEIDFENKQVRFYEALTLESYVKNEITELRMSFSDIASANYVIGFSLSTGSQRTSQSTISESFTSLFVLPTSTSTLGDFVNMERFIATDENYNYKQLFRDLRIPLVFKKEDNPPEDIILNDIPASAFEVKTPDEAGLYLHNLCAGGDEDIATKICLACIHYLHIVTKEQITYPTIVEGKDSENHTYYYQAYYNKDYEVDDVFPSASQHIVIPFIAEVKGLEAFAKFLDGKATSTMYDNRHGIAIVGTYKNVNSVIADYMDSASFSDMISELNDKFGYYIQSMFVTPYSELSSRGSYSDARTLFEFYAKVVNEDTPKTTPLIRRKRRGTWWSGYTYQKISNPTKNIEDYDNLVVSEPTLVLLSYSPIEKSANQKEFANIPEVSFSLDGDIDNPTGLNINADITDYIMCYGFLVGKKGYEMTDSSGNIKKQKLALNYQVTLSTLKSDYYEPILEMEPYSFYSISMSEIESVIDRKRYHQMGVTTHLESDKIDTTYYVPLFYNQSVNTMLKVGVVPEYTIDNNTQRYYAEELMFVTTSGITIKVDSYYEFMYVMSPKLQAQSHLALYNAQMENTKALISGVGSIISGVASGSTGGGVGGAISGVTGIINTFLTGQQNIHNVATNVKAEKSSAGRKADTFQQSGSDYVYELNLDEYAIMLNHYRIDRLSYESISKMLERYGYQVSLYDTIKWDTRVGYNFVKLVSFDFVEETIKATEEQMKTIDRILKNGLTMLHQKDFLHGTGHNYEVELDLVPLSQ